MVQKDPVHIWYLVDDTQDWVGLVGTTHINALFPSAVTDGSCSEFGVATRKDQIKEAELFVIQCYYYSFVEAESDHFRISTLHC